LPPSEALGDFTATARMLPLSALAVGIGVLVALKDMLKARTRHLEEERRRERVLPLSALIPFARFMAFGRRDVASAPPSKAPPPPVQ
jgi:hypothetical protein